MRYIIIVRATPDTEAGSSPGSDETLRPALAAYHEQLGQAGVLLDAAGLKPSRDGWRIRYGSGSKQVANGPFAETNELIAGYTLIQVRDREEAMEWARRFPAPMGEGMPAEIEVRELYDTDDRRADVSGLGPAR
ncbi:YciI family protein [Aquincola sp. MAHUQ-54]|uniref:YciI family protein n=1 Tax=Aquincola agrisoli TaxID=3119538 RepID=A0AAW9QHY2_9BURK